MKFIYNMKFTYTARLFAFILWTFVASYGFAQTATFANLDGNGASMSTTGWTVMGNANVLGVPNVLDTNGDLDGNPNELQLALPQNSSAGGVFFNGSLNMATTCDYWIADFDLRMSEGTAYDGMAFIVTSAIPTSTPTTSGNLLGMPFGGFTGFSVCMDGFNDCGGAAPNLEIRYNTTDECSAGPTVALPALIQNAYNNFKVMYKNGLIEVYINGAASPSLTGNYNLNFPTFFGFTAANGATANGKYSIKNASIYVIVPTVDAGTDKIGCDGTFASIGSASLPYYTYTWTPTANLSDSLASNPGVAFSNTGILADTISYIVNASIGTCVLHDTVSVVSVPIPTAPTITGPLSAICEGSSVSLSATPLASEQVMWYDVATGGTPLFTGYNFTTPFLSTNTTFYAQAINNNLCTSPTRSSITVVVNAAPPSPVATAPKICEGKDGVFMVSSPLGATYSWYTSPSSNLPIYNGTQTSVNIGMITNDTTLYVSATNASGCTSIALTPVTLQVDVTPPAPTMISDTVCKGQTANISAITGTGNTIKWFVSTVSATPLFVGANYTTPGLSQNTVYYANATTSIGCVGPFANLMVGVIDRPDTCIAISDTICPGGVAHLTVVPNSNTQYLWYDSPTASNPIFTGNVFSVSLNTSTPYYIQSKVGQCTSLQKAHARGIVDYFPPTPLVLDQTICPGGTVELRVKTPSDDIAHFGWYTNNNQLLYEGRVYKITNITSPLSLHVRSFSHLANCPNEIDEIVQVNLHPVPIANFAFDPDTVEVNEVVNFTDSSMTSLGSPINTGLHYFWDLGDGNYATYPKVTFNYTAEGLYPVTLIAFNQYNCSDTITKHVFVYDIKEVYIPTAFSPNHDGFNDELTILTGYNTKSFSIKIYDRWGKLMFSSLNPNNPWTGVDPKYGEQVPEGVYLCIVEYTTSKGVKKVQKGSVTVVR